MKLEEAYFGVMSPSEPGTIVNLFDSMRVRHSIALYKTQDLATARLDPLSFCFGDTWGRAEWEWLACPLFGGDGVKVCTYDMYVRPNRDLLMGIVDSISENSCRIWLKEYNKKYETSRKRKSRQ